MACESRLKVDLAEPVRVADDEVEMTVTNALGQPIGDPLPTWTPPPAPTRIAMTGRYCRLEPMDERFASELYAAAAHDADGRSWTYLPYGPFASADAYREWIRTACLGDDPLFFAIVDATTGRAAGLASYLRIDPRVGTLEVGHLQFSPALQRTTAATEAMVLMMRHALGELGYRRYEWKCDALNARSRRAAERLGFRFEGVFRNASVYKGRSRDTAWFSVLDSEWPEQDARFRRWLDPANFDSGGRQRHPLGP